IETTTSGGLVSLSAQRGQDEQLILDVVDSGSGISPGEIAAALDPLAERIYGAGEEPAGLGLALVKKLVDLHGGTFTIRSKPGIGTQVRVT
ncbi:sensor histidine kinase, partial [Klebsiella pneumoniae]|uniref:sensor histidine kinase n=1 Tax=Klebsiella pneumoniae TaxID=573 RepID=UPI0013D5E830